MFFSAERRQLVLMISCALTLGGCALSSTSGGGSGSDDASSDYDVMASVAAEAISARLVEEGLDQTLADEISTLTAEVAVNGAEEEEASESDGSTDEVVRKRAPADAAASGKVVSRFLKNMGGGFVATLVTLQDELPVAVAADELVSAVAEEIAQLPSHELIAPLLDSDEDPADVMEEVTSEVLPTAALLGLISEANMAAFIAKFGEAAFAGLAESGYIDDTAAAEKALDRLILAASGALGTLYSGSTGTTLEDAVEKLSEGVVKGIQRFPAVASHIDLDKAFEVITASGVVGLLGAGMTDSQVGSLATTFVSGLASGALGGLNPTGGGTPAFSATQINTALNSCGTFLSAALASAGAATSMDLSTLSGSGTQILSAITTTLAGFSSVPGVSVPSSCTVSVAAPSSGTGGGAATTCTAASTPFVGTGTHQAVGMTMSLNGTSLLRLAQGFESPASATTLAAVKIYGRVTSGAPTVSVYVLSAADIGTLSSATPKGSVAPSPTATANEWVTVNLTQSVPLTPSTNYVLGFTISGGTFDFRRGFPTSGVAADSLIHPGTVYQDGGSGMTPVNATRGDDLDVALFGCQ